MNKRQAKKKRKKEQQRADYYVALEELPEIVQRISEGIKEALDRLREAISEINVEEVCKQIKAEKEAGHGTN